LFRVEARATRCQRCRRDGENHEARQGRSADELLDSWPSACGNPAAIVRLWIGGAFDIIVSDILLAELALVVRRPRFRRWLSEEQGLRLIRQLRAEAVLLPDPPSGARLSRDPKDDYLLAPAASSGAVPLISGDLDLLALVDAEPPVLTPRAFSSLAFREGDRARGPLRRDLPRRSTSPRTPRFRRWLVP
jgi:putative PIN family toxin of toxin-antitoxin system